MSYNPHVSPTHPLASPTHPHAKINDYWQILIHMYVSPTHQTSSLQYPYAPMQSYALFCPGWTQGILLGH